MSDVQARIQQLVDQHPYLLFMKGSRGMPQCGFSAAVIEILDEYLPHYETVNVLADPEVREGVKAFSDWPTIPQLYVKGEFVGGADIVRELHSTGELESVLGQKPIDVSAPDLTVTDAALAAFQEAAGEEEHKTLRLEINGRWQYALSFGPEMKGDIAVERKGLRILMDRGTARRAGGMSIDFVTGPEGTGFKIENPNEPPKVKLIKPAQLKEKLDAGAVQHLYDVRTDEEIAIARLEGSVQLDDEAAKQIEALPRDTPLVFMCKSGPRSQRAAEHFLQMGFKEVYNLAGGINAWSREVDPSVPQY